MTAESGEFPKQVEDNFLSQEISETAKGERCPPRAVVWGQGRPCGRDVSKLLSWPQHSSSGYVQTFWREEKKDQHYHSGLQESKPYPTWVSSVPWESILEGLGGFHASWSLYKHHLFKSNSRQSCCAVSKVSGAAQRIAVNGVGWWLVTWLVVFN